MWARVFEFFIAAWLALSPFIFGYATGETFYWANDFILAFLIMLFSLASFWRPLDKIHLAIIPIGAWLIAIAFLISPPPPPKIQNYVVVGLILLMVCVLPSRAEQLPRSWLKFYEKRSE